jgi:glycosyltransferase involved in cell wall biosynthesis/tetratricopeptide (TPR) repeat protein
MSLRFLFGPVTAEFAETRLGDLRRAGLCLAFGPGGDLTVGPEACWGDAAAQFPSGWSPDLVALWLNYTAIPPGLWSAPVPLVGLATDWNLLWHVYRHVLPYCDAVLTDAPGVETLARAGIDHARPALLFGAAPDSLADPPAAQRDIDILFVGNLHPAVQRERLPWLARLARLAGRWRVAIRTGVPSAECSALLARAKVAFNRSVRSEANMRAFEAAVAGALLFQEAGNRELPALFADRCECVYYRDEDLEALLEHYLTHEDERQAIAAAARAKVAAYTFPALSVRALQELWRAERPGLVERARARQLRSTSAPCAGLSLAARVWMRLGDAGAGAGSCGGDDRLEADLAAAAGSEGASAEAGAAWHALGILTPDPRAAAALFRRALEADPSHATAGLALAEALAASGDRTAAVEQARQSLARQEEGPASPAAERRATSGRGPAGPKAGSDTAAWDGPTYPARFDDLRVEWERAAWHHAGDRAGEVAAKRGLIHWRLHVLLAALTGELSHFEAAAGLDLPTDHAALGCALARAGRLADALPHLRRAVTASPFDAAAARALFQLLGELGCPEHQQALARDRLLLARAVPQMVPPEPWFAPPAPPTPAAPARRSQAPGRPARVVWEGDQEGLHSLALVNRALCGALIDRGYDLGLVPVTMPGENGVSTAERLPIDSRLSALLGRGPAGGPAQVHVRHAWPPRLDPPAQGRWVFMQPWEFGSLPKAWPPALRRVDEVWAYSRSVRDCYLEAGVPPERVHVVPLGVDPAIFHPGVEPLALPPGPSFRFLFVGGTIYRKGFDLLLAAYTRAFRPTDRVGLVVKDMGTRSFYRGQTAEALVAEHRARGYPIEYLDRTLDERELAGLYAACDCLAHPYRGEGFALPVVEAMACGLAAIVTGAGPARDYASEATAFLLPARRAEFPTCRVGDWETVGRPWLWEPDLEALVALLRLAASDPLLARSKGAAALAWIRERFTWSRSADAVENRLHALIAEDGGKTRSAHVGTRIGQFGHPGQSPVSAHSASSALRLCAEPLRRAKVSLTIIARDEQNNLPRCLKSVAGLFDEVVVVDTGSADRTVEIASSFGARVFDFVWVDDFSAARNAALARAEGDYAFWLDADDVVDAPQGERLRALLARLRACDQVAYVVRCACDPGEDGTGGETVVDHIRLFPLRDDVRWTYRVHEQILPALRRAGIPVQWSDVIVRHTGYTDTALRARKLERDSKILHQELAERPDDPFVLFNLGAIANERKEWRQALEYLRRSLVGSAPTDSITRKLYALIARAHQMLGEPQQAIAACMAGQQIDPDDAELLFREAVVRRLCADRDGAQRCFRRILTLMRPDQFSSVDQGIYGHLTRRNLAALATERGDHAEAARLWREVLAECPGDREAESRCKNDPPKAEHAAYKPRVAKQCEPPGS